MVARLDGRVREVRVTDWDSYSGAVRVLWPPQPPSAVARLSQNFGKTKIAEAQYEPLDPESFKVATKG